MREFWRRDTLLWVAAAVAVGLTAVAGSFNVQRMRDTERSVRAGHETMAELLGLLSDMKDAETGHRGYLLTGRPDFLEPYRESEARVRGRVATLDAGWAGEPHKQTRLGQMRQLVADKFTEMQRTRELRDSGGLEAGAVGVAKGEGKRIMDALRDVCADAELEEQADLLGQGATADRQYQTAEWTNLIGAVLAMVVIGVSGVLLRRDARRREKAAAALAETAAALATERLATDRALAQLDALVRNAPYSIAFLDHELRPVMVNETFARATRVAVEDHFGHRLPDLFPDIPSALLTKYQEVLAGGPPVVGRLVLGDGRVWEVSAFQVPLDDKHGGLGVIGQDVTERQAAERQVQESASQLAQLTEGVPLLMWACSPTGECDYLSRQWLDYTGRGLVEQLGSGWLEAVHDEDREETAAAWRKAVDAGGGFEVEYRLRRHDGAYRSFAVRGIPLRDQTGTVVRWFGSCTDVDDRVRQEIRLEQMVEDRTAALRTSNQELEKFAYIASHDLQEPLRKIQAFGTRLADKYKDAVGEQGKEYIDRMLDSAGRMRRLIDDLLAFSRVTTKVVAFAAVDLNAVARDVLSDLEERVARSGGTVEVGPLPTLPGDHSQLRQVFQNLIANALKFAKPDTPPVVRVTAVPFGQLPADAPPPPAPAGWRITVADNGIGFAPQYAERIFELFQRLHGRREYEGTGLGLAIVRKIVVRHGATITAHSQQGHGAEFVLDWPAPRGD